MQGNLLIISAPSGTGKTTILKKVMSGLAGTTFSISHTTRSPRSGERNGVDYHFTDIQSFKDMRDKNDFLEWAEVHENFYGTSKQTVLEQLEKGFDVFLDIDVQGAKQVVQSSGLECRSIFIIPPSWEEQERRLTQRGTDSPEVIRLRLENARKEMTDLDLYDYLIVNDQLDKAVETLRSIIIAERSRQKRDIDGKALSNPVAKVTIK